MPVTSQDIVNQAVQMLGGNQPLVTGQAPNFDSSTTGVAASKLYSACVATVARQHAWDFARAFVGLTLTGNPPPLGWAFEYFYPGTIQLWQVGPPTVSDVNNPLPVTWDVGNNIVASVQQRVIWTNQDNAVAYYNGNPVESAWDSDFREAVVRLLASELAIALAGKPDTAQGLLNSGAEFAQIAMSRDS